MLEGLDGAVVGAYELSSFRMDTVRPVEFLTSMVEWGFRVMGGNVGGGRNL